jgi:hypothetical protein
LPLDSNTFMLESTNDPDILKHKTSDRWVRFFGKTL